MKPAFYANIYIYIILCHPMWYKLLQLRVSFPIKSPSYKISAPLHPVK